MHVSGQCVGVALFGLQRNPIRLSIYPIPCLLEGVELELE